MARLYEEVDLVRTLEPSADVIVGIKYMARGGCEMGPSLVRTTQALLRIDSVREVILCQLLPRLELHTTNRARRDFNTRVIVNERMHSLCANLGHIHVWPHCGMHSARQTFSIHREPV